MNHESITINGQKINREGLPAFTHAWKGDAGIPDFLNSWFDGENFIPAFTSGSTGKPKKIKLIKEYARHSALATLNILDLKKGDSSLLSMPANYIAGRMMLVRAIVGQLNLIPVLPSSAPSIPDRTIDLAAFTPHQFRGIIESENNGHYRRIKNILLGGSPVPEELIDGLEKFPGRIFETFGMTETYSHIALRMRYPVKEEYFQAVGPVSFSLENERLVIHAPHLGIEALNTNDLVELDGTRRFRWLGRSDYVINSGGIKLHPEIIEAKLATVLKSPFFITGKPDKIYGQKVVLVVERSEKASTEDQLINEINQILSKYEKPKSIIWVDYMVMTTTGKINRNATINHFNI